MHINTWAGSPALVAHIMSVETAMSLYMEHMGSHCDDYFFLHKRLSIAFFLKSH